MRSHWTAKLRQVTRRFLGERGAVTVDGVVWLCVFVVMFAFATDASLLFQRQAIIQDVAREIARAVATGAMTDTEAQTLLGRLPGGEDWNEARIEVVEGNVQVAVSTAFGNAMVFGGAFVPESRMYGHAVMAAEVALPETDDGSGGSS